MLEKKDLRALRNADTVSFHYDGKQHYIMATKDRQNTDDGFEQKVKIVVDGGVHKHAHGTGFSKEVTSCFSWICSPKYARHWRTVTQQLKVGDKICFQWVMDSSQWLTERNLLIYDFRIGVTRYSKSGKFSEYEYIMDQRVGDMTGHITGMMRFD